MKKSDIQEQFHLIEYLIQRLFLEGIEDIIISPGSRNAPIVEALVSFNKFTLHSIIDERSAAFFALGCNIQTNKPSALICTSGSAVLNYAPGISEAFYQGRPLIVISADRPESFVGQMAGQTIQQQNALGNFVKSFQQLSSENDLFFNKRKIEDSIFLMNNELNGPIHLNIPLTEPFYGYSYQFNHQVKKISHYTYNSVHTSIVSELNECWVSKSKILILCGCLDDNEELHKSLSHVSQDPRVVILTETTSNTHLEKSFDSIDNLMMQIEPSELYSPELLITLGRNVVSKKIKSFLKNSSIQEHWSFDDENHMIDTYGHLSHKVRFPAELLLSKLNLSTKGNYWSEYNKLEQHSRTIQKNYLKDLEFCDLKAYDIIFENIPENSIIHYGNSSVVRYSNLFDLKSKKLTAFANRGTSGIDGSLSTAVGYATKSDKINTLIIGDISFIYDSNGLWNNNLPNNLRIIIVNNGGGGIFDIIDGAKDSPVNQKFLKCELHKFQAITLNNTELTCNYHTNVLSDLQNLLTTKFEQQITTINSSLVNNSEYLKQFISILKK